jgi:hypothetical protein
VRCFSTNVKTIDQYLLVSLGDIMINVVARVSGHKEQDSTSPSCRLLKQVSPWTIRRLNWKDDSSDVSTMDEDNTDDRPHHNSLGNVSRMPWTTCIVEFHKF